MKTFREVAEGGLPLHVFPQVIRDFIDGFAKGSGSQPSFVAAGVLACSAGVVDGYSLEVKYGYIEKPNLYIAVVGNPGVSKSPPIKSAMKPLSDIDSLKRIEFSKKKKFFELEMKGLSPKERREFQKSSPEEPPLRLITDGTIEGLVVQLSKCHEANEQPHAVYMRDELKGHFGGMDQYKSGGGDDYESWLTLFSGGPISRALKSETIFIPDARASVIGGIQPEVYHEHMQDKGDGMIDRFIVAYHDGAPEMTDIFSFVDNEVIKDYKEFMMELYDSAPIEYSLWEIEKGKRKEALSAVQDFFKWTHSLGIEYECGAFKKWEQQFCRICIHLAAMHRKKQIDIEIIEWAKELTAFYATDWLKSRLVGEEEKEEKVDKKVLKLIDGSRALGCTASTIRQKIWDFRGREKKKFFTDAMDRMRTSGKVIVKDGRYFLGSGGGLDV